MTIDERLDWMISIEKCTDNLATEDVRKMIAHHARIIKGLLKQKAGLHLMDDVLRLRTLLTKVYNIMTTGYHNPSKRIYDIDELIEQIEKEVVE